MSYMTELFGAAFDEDRRIPELDETLSSKAHESPLSHPDAVLCDQRIRAEQRAADVAIARGLECASIDNSQWNACREAIAKAIEAGGEK